MCEVASTTQCPNAPKVKIRKKYTDLITFPNNETDLKVIAVVSKGQRLFLPLIGSVRLKPKAQG